MFAELLATPGVDEVVELRSSFGFMAFHGGALEKVTDVVASEAAKSAGASYYGVLHPDVAEVPHIPSTAVCPTESPALATFFEHVDVVVSIHGYGRRHLRWSLLLGGRNRALASHVAQHLRPLLPDYDIVDDLARIPKGLRGQHRANPVNLASEAGLQIELPPTVRWKWGTREWSDRGDGRRAPQTQTLIDALAAAALAWPESSDPIAAPLGVSNRDRP